MPTYSYACTECAHRFDAVQAFSDSSLTECPQCTGLLRKQYGSVGVVFKGSGFYRTDSRNGGSRSGGHSTSEKSSGSDTAGSQNPSNGSGTSDSASGSTGSTTSGGSSDTSKAGSSSSAGSS